MRRGHEVAKGIMSILERRGGGFEFEFERETREQCKFLVGYIGVNERIGWPSSGSRW